MHILAISGFNVGIVAYVIFLFLKIFPLGRRGHYILTILILIVYAVLTGGQPPVVRATIMAVVFLAGFILEREPESINTLSCAALFILLVNPVNLFDVGFQLSFVSVLAIIVFYPKCVSVFAKFGDKTSSKSKAVAAGMSVLRYIGQSFVLSFCAPMEGGGHGRLLFRVCHPGRHSREPGRDPFGLPDRHPGDRAFC